MFKNVSWPINNCLKYFMAPAKTLLPPLLHTLYTVFTILSRTTSVGDSLKTFFKVVKEAKVDFAVEDGDESN